LLLAAVARPSEVECATVDHGLRSGSREEADAVGKVCERLGLRHQVLTVEWPKKPETAVQEQARTARYRLLADWAKERGLSAVATAHHLDDQVETFIMRLARGSGVRGLAGMRPTSKVPGSDIPLIRPLLGWRRSELVAICAAAGTQPAADPSNEDEQFERIRVRHALSLVDWLDPAALASSAANLREADSALDWAAGLEWSRAVTNGGAEIVYRPSDAPPEIRRRIVSQVVARLATEGKGSPLKGREVDNLLAALGSGGTATLRGVRCSGGQAWRFTKAPPRRG
jgi:tRNA(Ile)-lysidine synthase